MNSVVSWLLVCAGVAQMILGAAHAYLPRMLHWNTDLAATSDITQAVSYVHSFFIGFMVFAMGLGSVVLRHDLLTEPRLGRVLAGFLAVFWCCRLLTQITVFRPVMSQLPGAPWLQWVGLAGWAGLTVIYASTFVLNLTVSLQV